MGHMLRLNIEKLPAHKPHVVDFAKIKRRAIDFLPKINPRVQEEVDILQSWCDHFRQVDAPFKVVCDGKYLQLWKIRRDL